MIDADVLAREVVAPGSDGLREIATLWPQAIGPDGALDRAALARIVFADDAARERSTRSPIRACGRGPRSSRKPPPDGLIVHVIPLLFEGESWRGFDKTVLVIAPAESASRG